MNYQEPVPTQGQNARDLGNWPQREIDLPWPYIDASHYQTAVLTQQPCTSWPEEVLEGPASLYLMQYQNLSDYPSHISSPLYNASWHPSEMVIQTSTLQLPNTILDHAQGSYIDEDLIFHEYQDLSGTHAQDGSERESTQFLPLMYNFRTRLLMLPGTPLICRALFKLYFQILDLKRG